LWLPLEDLVRKFADNDLRVYFVKDALLCVVLISMLPRLRGTWRSPLGAAWRPTLILFAFAAAMAIPSFVQDPAIPIIGIHARFLYVLLFPVGAFLAQDRRRLENALFLLTCLCVVVCAIGIAQAIVGPDFLNPAAPSRTLEHLTVIRNVGDTSIARPSGPFADVSRFASLTILTVVLALCSLGLSRDSRRRRVAIASVAIGVLAGFASGSRTSLFVTVGIVVVIGLGQSRLGTARQRRLVIASLALAAFVAAIAGGGVGDTSSRTAQFYAQTIDPRSARFEVSNRLRVYGANVVAGIRHGGLVGRGTGTETLGKRYLNDAPLGSETESGWGSIAAEWGIVGLLVWSFWVVAWTRMAFKKRSLRSAPADPIRPVIACYIVVVLIVTFSLGLGFFENYIANIFFWLLSGVAFSVPIEAQQLTRAEPLEYGAGAAAILAKPA
jgi:hypothetical protein